MYTSLGDSRERKFFGDILQIHYGGLHQVAYVIFRLSLVGGLGGDCILQLEGKRSEGL